MSKVLRLHVLPARHGDCLWLEYGSGDWIRHVLIDAGPKGVERTLRARIEASLGGTNSQVMDFELLVVTHIDEDHLGGVVGLLEDPSFPARFQDVWFNAYHHLTPSGDALEFLGVVKGERLSRLLVKLSQLNLLDWNRAFLGKAVLAGTQPPSITLEGGLQLTVLSPQQEQLNKLRLVWDKVCLRHGLLPGFVPPTIPQGVEGFGLCEQIAELASVEFARDDAVANGTSIALLAEFAGKRILLAGDAFPDIILNSLSKLTNRSPFRLDLMKLPHHGSRANVTRELIEAFDCPTYVVSTNGKIFDHPDREALAKVISHAGRPLDLFFNYRSQKTVEWDDPESIAKHGYAVHYGSEETGLTIDLF